MSMIAIPISGDVSSILRDIDVDGNRDPSDHLTLFYLGDEIPIETIFKVIEACLKVTKKQNPFTIKLDRYTTFDKGKHGYPVICRVSDKELFKLREDLKKELDKAEIEYSKTFPTFKPHVTLSYSPKKVDNGKFVPILWQVNNIAIYGGDENKERLYSELMFGAREKHSSIFLHDMARSFIKTAAAI